jgi:hypothetical protein
MGMPSFCLQHSTRSTIINLENLAMSDIRRAAMPKNGINIPEGGIDYAQLEEHPLAALLPMIEGSTFDLLKKDIRDQGLREKIKLWGGRSDGTVGALRILDGRNRYRALRENGHRFGGDEFEVMTFSDWASAEAYVLSTNFHRRQLSNAEKQEVIRKLIVKHPRETNRGLERIYGIPHTSIGNVRKAMANPKDKQRYERNREAFEDLLKMDDKWLVTFGEEFDVQLRELQELVAAGKAA